MFLLAYQFTALISVVPPLDVARLTIFPPRFPYPGSWRKGETEAVNRAVPNPKKMAVAITLSRLRVGALSAVTIQINGDWAPSEPIQTNSNTTTATPDPLPSTPTIKPDMTIRDTPQIAEVQITSARRPNLSGR